MNATQTTACSTATTLIPAALHAGLPAELPSWRATSQLPTIAQLAKVAEVADMPLGAPSAAGEPAVLARDCGRVSPKATQLPAEWTEVELLQRMMARESRAWREFHTRYDRLIYRAIHKVTQRFSSVLSSADVEEIYALLLCSLNSRDMHKLRTFEPERGHRLSTWVGLLATNAAWDYLRSLSRQPQRGNALEAEDVSCHNPDPFHALAAKEEWTRVRDLLSSFSEKDRTFVDLFFLQGRTPEQIADEMQISVKTVYSKKHKIRCRLELALGRPVVQAA
jgi:RNA polymerase sigma-70 factor (ECF subfamily)